MRKRAAVFVSVVFALCLLCGCGAYAGADVWHARPLAAARAANGFTLTVSSTLNDPSLDTKSANLTDGDPDTLWYSQWADEKNPACNEWILLDFGSVKKVESITLMPNVHRICFPADFTIGWGITGDVFPAIEGGTFANYEIAESGAETFAVNAVTRYIRIHITKRSANGDGNYLVSLAEVSAESRNATAVEIENAEKTDAAIERRPVEDDPVIKSTASASSALNRVVGTSGWAVENINDGSVATQWCAEWGSGISEEACDEWITLTFSSPQYVRGVMIYSQLIAHYGFPKDFDFSYTLDGENFVAVTDAKYTDEPITDTVHVKVFASPVVATAVRMNITASQPDSGGNYIPQLADLQAHGRAATETEVAEATKAFNAAIGAGETVITNKTSGTGAYAAGGAVMLAFSVALFGAGVALLLLLVLGKSGKPAVPAAQTQTAAGQDDPAPEKTDDTKEGNE